MRTRGGARWLVWVAALLVAAGSLAACGDDDEEPGGGGGAGGAVAEDGDGGGDDEAAGGEADEEAEDVSWQLNAAGFRGKDGRLVAFACPPDGELRTGWGTDVYTDDSSVCSAAVHAGLISVEDGGRVVVEIAPGEESYEGSERNGVTSTDYGPWDGSFTFPAADEG
jgi:hypothetical protein